MNTENNRIIAEFMGYEKIVFPDNSRWLGQYKNQFTKRIYELKELDFDSDWNLLMEVVEKINVLGYEVLIGRISCQINPISDRENPISAMVCGDIYKKIEITYDAIIQFIKWHNQQKQN